MSEDTKEILAVVGWAVLFVCFVVGLISIVIWVSSCKSSEVYNRMNETSWTCSDFFWAGEQIQSQRQTINIEGVEFPK
jgi:hypothetical protein